MVNVYIDGACSNNGKENAQAGYGVYFSEDNPFNEYGKVIGKQTNNTGELTALIRALEILNPELSTGIEVNVYTDSTYVITCATSMGPKLAAKNWNASKKKTPPNVELLKKIFSLLENTMNVTFIHIKAHTNDTDVHSLGNQEADKLANKAINLKECPYNVDVKKIYLDVPYAKKEIAKEHGAKWNPDEKKWYILDTCKSKDILLDLFNQIDKI